MTHQFDVLSPHKKQHTQAQTCNLQCSFDFGMQLKNKNFSCRDLILYLSLICKILEVSEITIGLDWTPSTTINCNIAMSTISISK